MDRAQSDRGLPIGQLRIAEQHPADVRAQRQVGDAILLQQLEDLFEALINLINTAIDEKSPYTGGHCERVPVLTNLLAEAAARTTVGPMAAFTMGSAIQGNRSRPKSARFHRTAFVRKARIAGVSAARCPVSTPIVMAGRPNQSTART